MPQSPKSRTRRIAFRCNEAEYAGIASLAAHVGEPSHGTATRNAAVAAAEHVDQLERALARYEDDHGTAASGARLLKAVRSYLAALRAKE